LIIHPSGFLIGSNVALRGIKSYCPYCPKKHKNLQAFSTICSILLWRVVFPSVEIVTTDQKVPRSSRGGCTSKNQGLRAF